MSTNGRNNPNQFYCKKWESFQKLFEKSLRHRRLLIKSSEPHELGTEIDVELVLPNGALLSMPGKVIRIKGPEKEGELHRVGLALSLGDDKLAELEATLSRGQSSHGDEKKESTEESKDSTRTAESASEPRPDMPAVQRGVAPVLGIDFGTSYSSIGYLTDAGATLIADDSGRTAFPSVVWFRGREDYVVGYEARERLATDPTRTLPSIKRLLGARIDDEIAGPILMSLACPGHAGPNRSIVFDVNDEQLSPVQITAIILKNLARLAESHLDATPSKIVLAHPLSFDDAQKDALAKASRIAGLELVGLVPEPQAAAMAYGHLGGEEGMVGVYDFGGGTFDFCALELKGGALKIASSGGDPWLGGDDLDIVVANRVTERFAKKSGLDLRRRAAEWQRIVHASEEAKVYLSVVNKIRVLVPEVAHTEEGVLDLDDELTRAQFVDLAQEIIETSLEVCRASLVESNLGARDVTQLLLTGGTTRIPAVRAAASQFFELTPASGINPDQAVVLGTTIKAAHVEGRIDTATRTRPVQVRRRLEETIGLALAGGEISPIFHKGTSLPATRTKVFSSHEDGQAAFALKLVKRGGSRSDDSQVIGKVNVPGLKTLPAGQVRVEVSFEIDEVGVLNVAARDLSTGRRFASTFKVIADSE